MGLQFLVRQDGASGVFRPSADTASLEPAFDSLLMQRDAGLDDAEYTARLRAVCTQAPGFLDAHAHLAFLLFEQGRADQAWAVASQALTLAESCIPDGFHGQVPWDDLENRPYLRVLQAGALAAIGLQQHADALALIQRMLARNPQDQQGARFLLGSEYLRLGQHEPARDCFIRQRDDHPSYCYELALSHILCQQWVPAATALRRGIALNPYIAEILSGNAHPEPLAIWHGSALKLPDTAADYLNTYGALWHDTAGAAAFVRWLYQHPLVLRERADVLECREALRWEREGRQRDAWILRHRQTLDAIDDTLSQRIVVQHRDHDGRQTYPWASALQF